jgi:hypothetical protein
LLPLRHGSNVLAFSNSEELLLFLQYIFRRLMLSMNGLLEKKLAFVTNIRPCQSDVH